MNKHWQKGDTSAGETGEGRNREVLPFRMFILLTSAFISGFLAGKLTLFWFVGEVMLWPDYQIDWPLISVSAPSGMSG